MRQRFLNVFLLLALTVPLGITGCGSESTPAGTGGGGGDKTPPTVADFGPQGSDISRVSDIFVEFDEEIAPTSITTTSMVISSPGLGEVFGTRTVVGPRATFRGLTILPAGLPIVVRVTTSVTDNAGNRLASDHEWQFQTAGGPTADAGVDQNVSLSTTISLDGNGSNDPTGRTLVYTWTQTGGPSVGALASEATPSFPAPAEVSTLSFELIVTAGGEVSAVDNIVVSVWEDASKRLFVSTTGGNDANDGSVALPKKTIQAAINAALANGADVYVERGTYAETITLQNGVSVYGGFLRSGSSWTRDVAANTTTINSSGATAMASNSASDITIDGLTVIAANATAAGGSSTAILIRGGNTVNITNNVLRPGNGAAGGNGSTGSTGATGSNGGTVGGNTQSGGGGGAAVGPTGFARSGAGGGGGSGGGAASVNGSDGGGGGTGSNGAVAGGGGGGGGSGNNATNGGGGGAGNPGLVGGPGSAGSSIGTLTTSAYSASNVGGVGAVGGGASGGGGAGGGEGSTFAEGTGGGGGSAGGAGGNGGTAGQGGGGSFGIVVTNGASDVTITGNAITTQDGGRGGNGGTGGNGGQPGVRGTSSSSDAGGSGGFGGNGGVGGRGGGGGGGGGGPTIGILSQVGLARFIESGNTFSLGQAGGGGTGGSGAATGAAGVRVNTRTL